jgi:DNA-binding MarR family transcriptional regulator
MTLLTAVPDTRPIDLARDLHMDRSTLSRNLKRLQTRGLVDVTPGNNARESRVTVTPAGRQATEQAAEVWFAAQKTTQIRLGVEGITALELLTRLLTTDEED